MNGRKLNLTHPHFHARTHFGMQARLRAVTVASTKAKGKDACMYSHLWDRTFVLKYGCPIDREHPLIAARKQSYTYALLLSHTLRPSLTCTYA
jgi:hypothetical protein